jgi:tRNA-dihydrouridine synthase B
MSAPLKPLRIGGLEIEFPVVLAALAGYSDLSYRLICRSLSAPYAATEAMLDRFVQVEGKLRRKLLRLDPADHPVAGQIMGNDPEVMAGAAVVLRDKGLDVVDLNFACPVRKVLGRRRGGALMDRPELALDIVRAVLKAVPDRPVTLKLRRSFREADQDCEAFWRIAHGAFDAGVAAICVHARSVELKYRGPADWDFLARVKAAFPDRTIIGSGDVLTAADALEMIRRTGVDGVACARGAIGNPWIFRQARDIAAGHEPMKPSLVEQRELIERHYRMTCDLYGPGLGLKILRSFGFKYAKLHSQPGKVRAAYVAVRTEDDWLRMMDEFYG